MLPLNQLTSSPVRADFLYPYGEYLPLSDKTYGGVALNDASRGRQVQLWAAYYDGASVVVGPSGGPPQQSVPIPGVTSCSLGFDANMNTVIGWMDGSGAHVRYFNSSTLGYSVLDVPGASSCKVRTDDTRAFNSTASDVIFAYTLNGYLNFRMERDRYAVEYRVGAVGAARLRLMGMSRGQRFQFAVY